MRILLTNSDFTYPGGTQSWVRSMHDALAANHKVHVHSHRPGLPKHFTPFDPSLVYDLALINHGACLVDLRGARIDTRIFTSHGIIPAEEWPRLGADAYVAVSELVASHMPWRSTIIRNPIDTQRFDDHAPVHDVVRRAVFLSNRQGRARPIIEEACRLAGVELTIIGRETAVSDPETAINQADLVFGIGRSALEGLACGRRVIAFDHLGCKGLVTRPNIDWMRRDSFAGYVDSWWPDPEELARMIRTAEPLSLRDLIVRDHSPEAVADAFLQLADQIPRMRRLRARAVRRGPRVLSSSRIPALLADLRHGRLDRVLHEVTGPPRAPYSPGLEPSPQPRSG